LIKGTEKVLPHLISGLQELGIRHIYLKNKHSPGFREEVALPNGFLTGESGLHIVVQENGLKFRIDIEKGQKTGFFIDQRDNRDLLRKYTAGKKVLNAFSYTGGFSVYALAGQAAMVHSVDISKDATQICDENISLNFGPAAAHQSITADCLITCAIPLSQYDVMVLDPPAFAKNARVCTQCFAWIQGPEHDSLSKRYRLAECCLLFPARRILTKTCLEKLYFRLLLMQSAMYVSCTSLRSQ
jgi:23S rRNA (cytosine1962-C5)-methyltransferase